MTPSVESMKKGTCGCGRSPDGNCCGYHSLTEEQWAKVKAKLDSDPFLNEVDDEHNVSDQGG